jgi:hypothetical protein
MTLELPLGFVPCPCGDCDLRISNDRVQEGKHLLVASLVPAITGEMLNGTPMPLRLDHRLASLPKQ